MSDIFDREYADTASDVDRMEPRLRLASAEQAKTLFMELDDVVLDDAHDKPAAVKRLLSRYRPTPH